MIEIIKKTSDYVIVYKPAGIPSQPDLGGDKDAMTHCSEQLRSMGEVGNLFLIHRLDRVVGGLLVFARNKESAATLSQLVADHNITKEYFAVAEGTLNGGLMKDYLYKDATLSKAFVTDKKRAGAKLAELSYETIESVCNNGKQLSLVKVKLKTGRFHQIRAQFASRKNALIGDKKYGSSDFKVKTPSLFAYKLSFCYKGEEINVTCLPDLEKYPWSLFEKEKYQ